MNKLIITSSLSLLLLLTSCSNSYKKPLPSSGVEAKEVASESYGSFKEALDELKNAFFTTKE